MQLPRDSRGCVALRLVLRYLRQRVQLSNVGRRLACYDSEGDGALREHDLENYVYESIAGEGYESLRAVPATCNLQWAACTSPVRSQPRVVPHVVAMHIH